jgi:acetyl-CoA acetyltransferase
MSADEAEKRGITPMARIASYATAGLDPKIMGVGPIYASRKALDKAGLFLISIWLRRMRHLLHRPVL